MSLLRKKTYKWIMPKRLSSLIWQNKGQRKKVKGKRQLEFGFRNAEFGRKDEKCDQG
jgi:hypothetical protein